jgi:hypothetical protein
LRRAAHIRAAHERFVQQPAMFKIWAWGLHSALMLSFAVGIEVALYFSNRSDGQNKPSGTFARTSLHGAVLSARQGSRCTRTISSISTGCSGQHSSSYAPRSCTTSLPADTARIRQSFFPTFLVYPLAYCWSVTWFWFRLYQPYITLAAGDAPATASVGQNYVRVSFSSLIA